MYRNVRQLLVTCAVLAGVGLVSAQVQPGPAASTAAPQQGRQFDPAKMAERTNRHLTALKQKLQITAAQDTAWNSFAAAMQPPANMQRPDRQALAAMSAPDRIDQMRALRDRRNAEMDRRGEATKAFYAQLTPEQKKTFDAETARMGHGPMHGHHGPQLRPGAPS